VKKQRLTTIVGLIFIMTALLSGCRWQTTTQYRLIKQAENLSGDLVRATKAELPPLNATQNDVVAFTADEVSCAVVMHIITEEDDPTETLNRLRQAYRYEADAKRGLKLAVLGKAYLRINDFYAWLEAYSEADTEQQRKLYEEALRRCVLHLR
jgi:hypothetical protein